MKARLLVIILTCVLPAACFKAAGSSSSSGEPGTGSSGGGTGSGTPRVAVGTGTLTPAGGDLVSEDGRVTVTFGINAVDRPVVFSIEGDSAPAQVFPAGVAYRIHSVPPGVAAEVTVLFRFTMQESAAANAVTDEDGGTLVFGQAGDAGFPGPHAGLPFHIPHLTRDAPDGGTFLLAGLTHAYTDPSAVGAFSTNVTLPVASLALRLSPTRIGFATVTTTGCCSEAPWPMELPVGAPPATYQFYLQTPSTNIRYYIDEVRDAFVAYPSLSSEMVAGRYELDIVGLGPLTTKTDTFTLACNAPGTGYVRFETQGFWQLGGPPEIAHALEHARLMAPFRCVDGSSSSGGPPAASGFAPVLRGEGVMTQAGADVVSEDGRVVVSFLPDAVNRASRVSIKPAAHALAGAVPAGRGYDVEQFSDEHDVPASISYRLTPSELLDAEHAAADGRPLTYVSPGDAGFPGAGAMFHFLNPVAMDADGGFTTASASTVLDVDGEGGTTFVGATGTPASSFSVRLAPLRLGVSASSGDCCAQSPWPVVLHVGAEPMPYHVYWQNAVEGVEYTAAFLDVTTAAQGALLELTSGLDEFQGQAAFTPAGPGITRRREFLVACHGVGNSSVVITTSGGVSPFTEADWDFAWVTVPVTCVEP
jgi:hypothetical protein